MSLSLVEPRWINEKGQLVHPVSETQTQAPTFEIITDKIDDIGFSLSSSAPVSVPYTRTFTGPPNGVFTGFFSCSFEIEESSSFVNPIIIGHTCNINKEIVQTNSNQLITASGSIEIKNIDSEPVSGTASISMRAIYMIPNTTTERSVLVEEIVD